MGKKSFLLALVLLLTVYFISAADFPIPKDKYVNDFSGMFSANETLNLRMLFYNTEQSTTAEVVLVTIADCSGDYDSYAVNLANSWRIGKKDKNNGLLMLYCVTEKKFVIKTGYGLEGILPDSKIGRYLDENYVPLRDLNQTKEGIILFSQEIVKVLENNKEEIISGQKSSNKDFDYIFLILVILLIYTIISRIVRKKYKDKKGKDKKNIPWFIPIFFPVRSSSSGFSGSGGFGGGGFGGGGFGGGGASR